MTEAAKPHPSVAAYPEQFRPFLNDLRLEASSRRSIKYISTELNHAGGEDWLNVTMHVDPSKRSENIEDVWLIEQMNITHHLALTTIVLGSEYIKDREPQLDYGVMPGIVYRQSQDWPAVQFTLFKADFHWPQG